MNDIEDRDADESRARAGDRVMKITTIGTGYIGPAANMASGLLLFHSPTVRQASSALDACDRGDALAIVTKWKALRRSNFGAIRQRLLEPVIVDARSLYSPALVHRAGLHYEAIGRGENAVRETS